MAINLQKAEFILSAASPKDFLHDGLPQVAFAGRSNVGKSSVINRLLNRKNFARVGAAPGKTTQINYFKIDNAFYLVDLPGYGYAKGSKSEREDIERVIREYITGSGELSLLFVLIDSRYEITRIDLDFIAELGEHGIPFAIILTKCDKQGPKVLEQTLEKDREALSERWEVLPDILCCSSRTGKGKKEILDYIGRVLQEL